MSRLFAFASILLLASPALATEPAAKDAAAKPTDPAPGHCDGAKASTVLADNAPGHCDGAKASTVLADNAPGHCDGAKASTVLADNAVEK